MEITKDESITLREMAKLEGVSYEAIRQRVRALEKLPDNPLKDCPIVKKANTNGRTTRNTMYLTSEGQDIVRRYSKRIKEEVEHEIVLFVDKNDEPADVEVIEEPGRIYEAVDGLLRRIAILKDKNKDLNKDVERLKKEKRIIRGMNEDLNSRVSNLKGQLNKNYDECTECRKRYEEELKATNDILTELQDKYENKRKELMYVNSEYINMREELDRANENKNLLRKFFAGFQK